MANKIVAAIAFSVVFFTVSFADAAQSACARKFIGRWTWHGPTATTTMDILASGEAPCSNHPACVRGSGAWSCSGNQLTYNNGMYDTVLTLQPGGNVMTGHGGLGNGLQTVVRDGAPINDPTPKTASVPSSQSGPAKPQQSKSATTKGTQPDVAKRLATGPVVDAGALRSRQGNCSDITGTGGGSAPINCPPSNGVPPNVQSQINASKSNQQLTNSQQPNLPNNGRTAAVEEAVQKLEEAKAALEAAGDLAAAANTAEQINILRKRTSCPALAPEEFWKNTENEEYCSTANCTERGTAFYGMLCTFKYKDGELSRDERDKICKEALVKLTANSRSDETFADQMFHQKIPCNADGTPMGLRDRLRRALRE
jgi:hypothetical protein